VIDSGFTAAKVLLFCDIDKRKMHFYAKIGRKSAKIERIQEEKHHEYPLNTKIEIIWRIISAVNNKRPCRLTIGGIRRK
jgi:hypothetical protein